MPYEKESEIGAVLQSIITAAGHVKNGARVSIYADCEAFISIIDGGFLEKWASNGWLTTKGQPVKEGEKWRKVAYLLSHYDISISKDDNGYKKYMREQLKRRETA